VSSNASSVFVLFLHVFTCFGFYFFGWGRFILRFGGLLVVVSF